MIKSGGSKLTGYTKEAPDFSPLIKSYADSFINPVKSIAAVSGGSSDKFYSGLKYYSEGALTVGNELVAVPDKGKANSAWGMMIQFMMFSSVFSATLLITDKENRTFFRTLSASIRMKSYMFQSILSFLTIAILQIAVLLAVTVGGLGVYPGVSVLNMFVLLAVFSLVSISMGIAIGSFSRSTLQASIYGAGIVVLMSLMGGAWGSLPTSGMVRNLSKLIPVTWAVESVDKLVDNASLASITGNLGILMLFAVVFFLLGTWRKADIAK
jgi:ABC-2 type transport system permease protein